MSLFASTAWYYARYRPRYPVALLERILARFAPGPDARLLDLGSGTGHLAIPLAPHFAEVIGLDPEPEMLAEAAAQAGAHANIRWMHGAAESLGALPLGRFQLVTIGAAFHWMDREATLATLSHLALPTGGIAVIDGGGNLWNGTADFQQALKAVIQRYLGAERRAGSTTFRAPAERHEAVIARSAFSRVERIEVAMVHRWTVETLIGHLYSTSFCSPALLGDKRPHFEQEVRETLHQLNPAGEFTEELRYAAILAGRP